MVCHHSAIFPSLFVARYVLPIFLDILSFNQWGGKISSYANKFLYLLKAIPHLTFACSKSAIETLERCEICSKLVKIPACFYCWLWTSTCQLDGSFKRLKRFVVGIPFSFNRLSKCKVLWNVFYKSPF